MSTTTFTSQSLAGEKVLRGKVSPLEKSLGASLVTPNVTTEKDFVQFDQSFPDLLNLKDRLAKIKIETLNTRCITPGPHSRCSTGTSSLSFSLSTDHSRDSSFETYDPQSGEFTVSNASWPPRSPTKANRTAQPKTARVKEARNLRRNMNHLLTQISKGKATDQEIVDLCDELLEYTQAGNKHPKSYLKGAHFEPQFGLADLVGTLKGQISLDPHALESINRLSTVFEQLPNNAEQLATSTANKLTGLARNALRDGMVMIISLVSGLLAIQTRKVFWMGLFALTWLYFGVTSEAGLMAWLTPLYDNLMSIFSSAKEAISNVFRPQGLGGDGIDLLVKLTIGTIISFAAKDRFKSKEVFTSEGMMTFLKKSADLAKAKEGLMDIVTWAQEFFYDALNFVRREFLGWDIIQWRSTKAPEVDEWCTSVIELSNRAYKGELQLNLDNSLIVHRAVLQGLKFTREFNAKEFAHVRDAINVHMNVLRKLEQTFVGVTLNNSAVRNQATLVLLRGKSGVGKTMATQALATMIMTEFFSRHDPAQIEAMESSLGNYFYARNFEQSFWDGYHEQFCCIIDDFGQAKSVAGNPDDEYMNVIRAAGIFQYNLHMAALEQKGKVNFTSKLIMCSTNLFNFTPDSIVEVEALERRFDVVVDVVPKKEFCTPETRDEPDPLNRRLDTSHPKLLTRDFQTCIYEFRLMRFVGRNKAEYVRSLEWDELKNLTVQKMEASLSAGDKYINFLKQHISSMKPQSGLDRVSNTFRDFSRMLKGDSCLQSFSESSKQILHEVSELCPEFQPQSRLNAAGRTLDEILEMEEVFEDAPTSNEYFAVIPPEFHESIAKLVFPEEHVEPVVASSALVSVVSQAYPEAMAEAAVRGPEHVFRLISVLLKSGEGNELSRRARVMVFGRPHWMLEKLQDLRVGITNWFGKVTESAQKLYDEHPWLTTAMAVTAISGSIVLLFKFLSKDGKEDFHMVDELDDPETEMDSGTFAKKKDGRAHRSKRAHLNPNIVQPEGGIDQNTEEILNKILKRGAYSLTIAEDPDRRLGNLLFVRGNIAIFPLHYLREVSNYIEADPERENYNLRIQGMFRGADEKILIPLKDFVSGDSYPIENKDMVLYQFKNMNMHPDLTKFFVERQHLDNIRELRNLILVRPGDMAADKFVLPYASIHDEVQTVKPSTYPAFDIKEYIKYLAPTKKGDCGSVLLFYNSIGGCGRIAGMHSAGDNKGVGLSPVITKESLCKWLSCASREKKWLYADPATQPFPEQVVLMTQCDIKPVQGEFVPLAVNDKPFCTPSSSKLRKSPLYEEWGPAKTAPAVLGTVKRDGERVDPMKKALAKYGRGRQPCRRQKEIDAAIVHYARSLRRTGNTFFRKPFRVFTFEEAVVGLTATPFAEAIPRDTSPGYPYNLEPKKGFPGKTRFFGRDQDYDLTGEECVQLKKDVMNILEDAKNGVRHLHVYSDCLKDERRKLEKVQEVKTRMISAAPLAYTIAFRMLFMDFFIYMRENRVENGSAIGIDVHSAEWDTLARLLMSRGPDTNAGDFTGYDTAHIIEIMGRFAGFVNDFYNDEWGLARETLMLDVTNSIHIVGDKIYLWFEKMPSGAPPTGDLNTWANNILNRASYACLHPNGVRGLEDYDEDVFFVAFGDDNVMNISPRAMQFFNMHTIPAVMAEFNQTYTSDVKDDKNPPASRKLEDITFLKRHFRYEPRLGRYVSPLDLDVVLESPYWYTDGPDSHANIRKSVDTALQELSVHTQSTFDIWAPRIIKASREILHYEPESISRSALMDKWSTVKTIH